MWFLKSLVPFGNERLGPSGAYFPQAVIDEIIPCVQHLGETQQCARPMKECAASANRRQVTWAAGKNHGDWHSWPLRRNDSGASSQMPLLSQRVAEVKRRSAKNDFWAILTSLAK